MNKVAFSFAVYMKILNKEEEGTKDKKCSQGEHEKSDNVDRTNGFNCEMQSTNVHSNLITRTACLRVG